MYINDNLLNETIKELKAIYEETTTSDLQGIAEVKAMWILKKSDIDLNRDNIEELTDDILEGVYN